MPGVLGQTREVVRVSVGRLLRVVKLIEADANGTTTTFLTDDIAIENTDTLNGKWLIFTSGQTNIDGQIRQVTDSSVSSNQVTLTFYPAVSNAPISPADAELWDQEYDPANVNDCIQMAIREVTGMLFDPEEDISLFADGKTARFDIPTVFEYVRDVYIRERVSSAEVHNMDTTFTTVTDADFTQAADTQDRKQGSASLKLTIAGAVSAGDVIAQSFTAKDLSKYTHIEGWIKASTTLAASDFAIQLREGAGTTRETLNLPATTAADIWTYFRVALANPRLDTAIDRIYLEYNANPVANTVWFDDVKVTVNDETDWVLMPRHLWSVDKEARDLILEPAGVSWARYGLIKLIGGDDPLLLADDADVNEVPENYLIYKTAGLLLLSQGSPRAGVFLDMAEREKRKLQPLVNARFVT